MRQPTPPEPEDIDHDIDHQPDTRRDHIADITSLPAGTLVEAVPAGIRADGTPITRPVRVRLDRAPWFHGNGNVVLSDGRSVCAVRADSVRVIDAAAVEDRRTCAYPGDHEHDHAMCQDVMAVAADDDLLDDLGGIRVENVTGDRLVEALGGIRVEDVTFEPLIKALRGLRQDVDTEPIPDNDDDVLTLATAQGLVAAMRAAQVSAAAVTVPLCAFTAWIDVLDAQHYQARWVQHLNRVHAWIEHAEHGVDLDVGTWCDQVTGYRITEDTGAVVIPAAEVGRLVAPATRGGAR